MKIGRETEVLGENLPQRYFVRHKSHMTRRGARKRNIEYSKTSLIRSNGGGAITRTNEAKDSPKNR
jgi:hypothetical protein